MSFDTYFLSVAENFLSPLSTPGGRPNFASPTYLAQIEGSGKREVYRYERGFKYLDFSSVQSKLKLGQQEHWYQRFTNCHS
jgi:hypothetical protein